MILTAITLFGVALCEVTAKKIKSAYYMSLITMVTVALFFGVVNEISDIYQLGRSPYGVLVLGVFALVLAEFAGLFFFLGLGVLAVIVMAVMRRLRMVMRREAGT